MLIADDEHRLVDQTGAVLRARRSRAQLGVAIPGHVDRETADARHRTGDDLVQSVSSARFGNRAARPRARTTVQGLSEEPSERGDRSAGGCRARH